MYESLSKVSSMMLVIFENSFKLHLPKGSTCNFKKIFKFHMAYSKSSIVLAFVRLPSTQIHVPFPVIYNLFSIQLHSSEILNMLVIAAGGYGSKFLNQPG